MMAIDSKPTVLCSTLYLINDKLEFLLLNHRKLKKWVPPGGKIEHGETPHQAAIRECYEEVGIQAKLLYFSMPENEQAMVKYATEFNPESVDQNPTLQYIFFNEPVTSNINVIISDEATECNWFSLKKIQSLDSFPSVYKWCKIYQNFCLSRKLIL